jgi:hypothetical protein
MTVWLATDTLSVEPTPAPTIARTSTVTASSKPEAIMVLNDQIYPEHSNDQMISQLNWWPRRNTTEWVQFDFPYPQEVSKVKLYWLDDGPDGGYRIPTSWKVQYRSKNEWMDVNLKEPYTINKDLWSSTRFNLIKTNALRVVVQLPEEHSTGLYEVIIE